MVQGKVIINNERGIHARPSAVIAQEAMKYSSDIILENSEKNIASAKDVLQLILLEMYKGTQILLTATGSDEKQAFDAVKNLLEKHYDFD